MIIARSFRAAFESLLVSKGRSMLTILGIVIGVAAVITMIAIGSGAQQEVEAQIRSLGANLLQVQAQARRTTQLARKRADTLTRADAEAIRQEVPAVSHVAPAVQVRAVLVNGNRNLATNVVGAVPDHLSAREWNPAFGRAFSGDDVRSASKVAVIGHTVAKSLYGTQDVAGRQIRINNIPFDIIGVLEEKGRSPFGYDQDEIVFAPLSTVKMRLVADTNLVNPDAVQFIYIKVRNTHLVGEAKAQITSLLRQRHQIRPGENDDFLIRDLVAMMRAQLEAGNTFTLLLASIAAVSLIVGGISIMNMMIVAVTERTGEIGLRLAVGAQPGHIRNQFLIESVTLCLIGGLVGIAVGIGASYIVAYYAQWVVVIEWWAIMLAFGFAAIVGVFFGFYPAVLASRLDPIEALRSE